MNSFACPKCGSDLELSLVLAPSMTTTSSTDSPGERRFAMVTPVFFTMGGRPFELERGHIFDAAKTSVPETIRKYYVLLPGSLGSDVAFPIKQIVRKALTELGEEKFRAVQDAGAFTAASHTLSSPTARISHYRYTSTG